MEEPLPTQLDPAPPSGAPGPRPPADWSRLPGPAPRPIAGFAIGQFLATTLRAWSRGLPTFALLGVAASVPTAIGLYRSLRALPAVAPPGLDPVEQLKQLAAAMERWWLLAIVAAAFEIAAVTYGAIARVRREEAGLGAMLVAGFRRGPSVLGVLVVAVGAFAVVSAAFAAVSTAFVLPVALMSVPIAILACGWIASPPLAVLERAGPFRALARSRELTRGFRSAIFVGFFVLLLAVLLGGTLVQTVTLSAFASSGGTDLSAPNPTLALPLLVSQLVSGAFRSLLTVGCAAAYQRLFLLKQGGEPVRLANAFE